MASTINVSGVFVFTVAASNAVYNEVTCNLAAIKMSAYNVQEQAVVFSFKKVDGDSQLALTAHPTLTVYNKSGVALLEQKTAAASSISYTIPVTGLATADRMMVRIYSDAARTKLLAQSAAISVVRENPMPFPRGESWTAAMVFKNGEMLLLDNVAYMWSSSVSGNSAIHPKTDIATNAATTYWVAYQNWPLLCTNLLIARLALIGQAVFYDEFMFSQHGTDVSGNPSTNYQGFADGTFKPNLLLNFLTGQLKCKNSELEGQITATSGVFNGYLKMPFIEKHSGSSMYLDLNEGSYYSIFGDNNSSVYLPDPDPFIGSSVIVNNPIPGTRVDISFTLKINSQNNNYFFYNGFNPFSDKKIIGIKASALMIKLIAVKVGDFRYWHIENFNEIKSDRLLY